MITRRQVGSGPNGAVHISAALPTRAPRVIEIQAGCSMSFLTPDEAEHLAAILLVTAKEAREGQEREAALDRKDGK